MTPEDAPTVVVIGANGLVGEHVCAALLERGAKVRSLVRREGASPAGTEEWVGDFTDRGVLGEVLAGADSVITTVHPMGSDLDTQREIGVEGNVAVAHAAVDAELDRLVHLSTCGLYSRTPDDGDVFEDSPLVPDDAGDYPVTKRDLDAELAEVDDLTRVLVRPPAILGHGESSVWNTLRPQAMASDPDERRTNPDQTFAWVHVDDLAALVADLAVGAPGPAKGECTAVNVAGEPATNRDYYGTVLDSLGLEPQWESGPAWTGQIRTDRAREWGWTSKVTLQAALDELRGDVRP